VHETIVRDGVRTEVHLCAEHAIDRGYLLPTNVGPALVVGKLLEKATQAAARSVKACPSCAMTMQVLRETGLVGCSDCYRHFEEELAAIIGRTQEGAATHVGRHPAQASSLIDRAAMRNRMVRELREAVAREEYERAARLRDEMLSLGLDSGGGDDEGSAGA
jgi:protein arginine kinase activator